MGGDTNLIQPAQPSYGEGLEKSLRAQAEMLMGTGDFADLAKEIGMGPGETFMQKLMEQYEAPLRKTTAQIDTDVMRQTLLGGEGKTTDQEGRVITGYTTPEPAGGGSALGGYQIVNLGLAGGASGSGSGELSQYGLVDKDGNVVLTAVDDPAEFGMGGLRGWDKGVKPGSGVTSLMAQAKKDGLLTPQQAAAGKKAEPIYETDPETNEPIIYKDDDGNVLSGQKVARSGDGMIDLMGDTRQVQESRKLSRDEQGQQLVEQNPELDQVYKASQNDPANPYYGLSKSEAGRKLLDDNNGDLSKIGEAFNIANLSLPEFAKMDTGRQAGFDESGEFRGLSALAEDIGRGGQQRAREADIADVERLGGRATDAYRAQGDLSGALGTARAMGAGGADQLSAIPKDPLFEGAALDSLADRARAENLNISAITGGRTGDYDPRAAQGLQPGFQGPQQPGQQSQQFAQPGGTDAFRSALMQQGMGALDQGITARENRAIQEAARARATNMGRTFDQTASIKEAEAVIEEDNARRMQNRAFAQSALGQEVGIQQADLARGLQAQQMELGRQSAGVDRQLTAEEKDIERIMRQQAMGEQYRQQGLGAERANAAQMVGLEQATSADPFQAILQRQGQNNLAAGGAVFGQAGYGLDSGPQYLNPEAGLGFIQNQSTNAANMYNAQVGAGATRSAGMMGGVGTALGGLFGGPVGAGIGGAIGGLFKKG